MAAAGSMLAWLKLQEVASAEYTPSDGWLGPQSVTGWACVTQQSHTTMSTSPPRALGFGWSQQVHSPVTDLV
jgi:hypothetical protein